MRLCVLRLQPQTPCAQALLPGRASYTDLLAALQRRGVGLSVVTGGVQPHRWLVLAALKVAEVGRGACGNQGHNPRRHVLATLGVVDVRLEA